MSGADVVAQICRAGSGVSVVDLVRGVTHILKVGEHVFMGLRFRFRFGIRISSSSLDGSDNSSDDLCFHLLLGRWSKRHSSSGSNRSIAGGRVLIKGKWPLAVLFPLVNNDL